MCSDKIRVAAYRDALAHASKTRTIIDVGAGTGILSFESVEQGASKVYAIEQAGIATRFQREVSRRGLKHMIKVMNCRAEEAPLEGIQADLIVSEWMGYFLLFERMLPSVLSVRDKCLVPGGLMIPGRARIYLAAAAIPQIKINLVDQSSDETMTVEALIQPVSSEFIISTAALTLDLDLANTPQEFDSFKSDFELTLERDSHLNSLVGWFDVEMTPGVWLSTSPFKD
jgi:predicted RNA methylase